MKIVLSEVYRLNPAIAIEDFGERSLALHCTKLRLVELNATARDLIHRLDGQANLHQIAISMVEDYGQALDTVLADLQATIAQMIELDVVERVRPIPAGETRL